MYPDWIQIFIPLTQDIFYAESLDYALESNDIESDLKKAGITDYKLVKKHGGFTMHCAKESLGKITTVLNLDHRKMRHEETNAWMTK